MTSPTHTHIYHTLPSHTHTAVRPSSELQPPVSPNVKKTNTDTLITAVKYTSDVLAADGMQGEQLANKRVRLNNLLMLVTQLSLFFKMFDYSL